MSTNLEKYLLDFGYNQNEIEKIQNDFILYKKNKETLLRNIISVNGLLLSLGYTKSNILKMINSCPSIYVISAETIKEKINSLINLGYKEKEIIKMSNLYSKFYTIGINNIKDKIDYMISLGYTKFDVLKMTKKVPSIYGRTNETINEKINDLIALGFTKQEVIKITRTSPQIFCYDIKNLKKKINIFVLFGYSYEETLKIIMQFPGILNLSEDNIKEKLSFYKLIKIEKVFINKPKNLMQSIDLSYARFMFYKSRGIVINEETFEKLFIGQDAFENRYKLDNKDLIKIYNYRNLIREKNKNMIKERLRKKNG